MPDVPARGVAEWGGGGAKLEKLRGCRQDPEKRVDPEQTEFRFRQHDGSSHKRFIDFSWIVSEKDLTLRSLYQGQLDTKNISFLTTCKLRDVKQCAWSSPCMWQPWQVWTRLDKNLMRKMLLEVSLFHNHDKFELGVRTWWGKNCLKFHFSNTPARSSKLAWKWKFKGGHVWSHSLIDAAHIVTHYMKATLRASLSGTFLQTLPDLVTPLKGHSLSPRSCPAMRSAPSERFGY